MKYLHQWGITRKSPMFNFRKRSDLPTQAEAFPGRARPLPTAERHFVNGRSLQSPEGMKKAVFGLGCFWGAERKFWEIGTGFG
jgi:peptide-methionine (S)-S-oxide reductase